MPVTINASTSSGLIASSDTSGNIELQNNGTTRLTVGSTNVTIPTGTVTTLTATTISDGTNSTSSTNVIQGSAKAWVAATATGGTPTVNGSYNVSSFTYAATGRFTVNFTNAMPNANYSMSANIGQNGTLTQIDGAQTTSATTFGCYNTSNVGFNPSAGSRIFCIVIGN
jgi:hypothetical protein